MREPVHVVVRNEPYREGLGLLEILGFIGMLYGFYEFTSGAPGDKVFGAILIIVGGVLLYNGYKKSRARIVRIRERQGFN